MQKFYASIQGWPVIQGRCAGTWTISGDRRLDGYSFQTYEAAYKAALTLVARPGDPDGSYFRQDIRVREVDSLREIDRIRRRQMTKAQLMDWAARVDVQPNPEGTVEEALMAGWINAMDVQDERKGNLGNEEFLRIAYSEVENMGYIR